MKKLFSVLKLFVLLTGLIFTAFSCVRPDMSDCPQENVRIVVKTHTETSRAETNNNGIESVTIYIFDEQNKFVQAWQGDAYIYGNVYEAYLNIKPGIYHFVVWANLGNTYTTSHSLNECSEQTPLMKELSLFLACPPDNCLTEEIPDLHHGILSEATVQANRNNEFTITLTPNTYKINFTVKGLPVCNDTYNFSIRDNNSHYTFNNAIIGGKDEFQYLRTTGFVNDKLTASMKVLRLMSDRSPMFNFTNTTTGETLYSDCLVTMINRAYSAAKQNVDFSRIFEFDITLAFDANLGVAVSINGWNYDENPGEL